MSDEVLESFIEQQAVLGERVSEGVFTVAADAEALRKLADFSLPFEGAWAVKIVQAAIASKSLKSASVTIEVIGIRFQFFGHNAWSPEDVQTAFMTLEPNSNRGLDHLVNGLRYVGLRNSQHFHVRFPSGQLLLWNGDEFKLKRSSFIFDGALEITVDQAPESTDRHPSSSGYSLEQIRKNRDIHQALCDCCYASPIPLTVDGRRLDNLFGQCSKPDIGGRFGPSFQLPIATGFPEANLVEWAVSAYTFDCMSHPSKQLTQELASQGIVQQIAPVSSAKLAYHLLANMAKSTDGSLFLQLSTPSLAWVQDGVVIQTEDLSLPGLPMELSMFASADGLKTDLTGFQLLESKEKKRREREILDVMRQEFQTLSEQTTVPENQEQKSSSLQEKASSFFVGAILSAPILLIFPIAPVIKAFLAAASGLALSRNAGEVVVQLPDFKAALRDLSLNWPEAES